MCTVKACLVLPARRVAPVVTSRLSAMIDACARAYSLHVGCTPSPEEHVRLVQRRASDTGPSLKSEPRGKGGDAQGGEKGGGGEAGRGAGEYDRLEAAPERCSSSPLSSEAISAATESAVHAASLAASSDVCRLARMALDVQELMAG